MINDDMDFEKLFTKIAPDLEIGLAPIAAMLPRSADSLKALAHEIFIQGCMAGWENAMDSDYVAIFEKSCKRLRAELDEVRAELAEANERAAHEYQRGLNDRE